MILKNILNYFSVLIKNVWLSDKNMKIIFLFFLRNKCMTKFQDFLHWSVLLTRKLLSQGFIETRLMSTHKKFFYHHLTLPYRVSVTTMAMPSVGHGSVVMSTFHSLIRHMGNHDECRMRSRKCLPFRSTWFHLWFS